MKPFVALPHLFSIQVINRLHQSHPDPLDNSQRPDPWDWRLAQSLSLQHEGLRRVYLHVPWLHLGDPRAFRHADVTWELEDGNIERKEGLITTEDMIRAIVD